MEDYLQTNNDLIISIHKAFVDSTQEINRKLENLRDDIRDVKLSLTKNDRTLQEEANNWRQHTETIVKELGERHQHDVASLHKIIMELCIRTGSSQSAQPALIMPQKEVQSAEQPTQKIDFMASKKEQIDKAITKNEEPVGFKPPPIATGNILQEQIVPKISTTTTTTVTTTTESIKASTPIVWGMPPSLGPRAGAVLGPELPSFKSTTMPTTETKVSTPAMTTVTPSPVTFSFKGPGIPPPSGGLFQGATTATTNGITSTTATGGSLFGGGVKSGINTFANLAAKAADSSGGFLSSGTAISKPQFGQTPFGSASAKDFKLFQQSSQPSLNSSILSSGKGADESHHAEEGSDKEDHNEEFVPDAHYEPVVPLPPEVEVATGEEEEDVMFSARCKLYRYDKEAKENKERGLGDIKLLFNPKNKRYRCVMRREQVYKLCANFPIHSDLKLIPREQMPTVYTWACKDFSEDTAGGTDETFSARFKDKAIAQEFYDKMMEAIGNSSMQ